MEEHEKIELRSDDVQEILGTPPSWIVNWGSTLIFIGVILLGLVSYYLKYPDIIYAPMQVTTKMPPVPVVARTTGYLSRLLVKENDSVNVGDLLVVLQSPAHYEDILKLEKDLTQFDSLTPSVLTAFQPEMGLKLGDLQLNYSSFVQILKEFQFKKEENFEAVNVSQIEQQIKNTERLIKTEQDKLATAIANIELNKKNVERNKTLYSQGVIPLSQYEEILKDANNQEQLIKNIRGNVDEFRGRILQLQRNRMEFQSSTKTSNSTQFNSLVESINQLRTAISKWKQTYLLTAPISGKISFFNNYWAESQDIKEGAEVMAIIPPNGSDIVGFVSLPMAGSGKVKEGQRVVIKFDSYPYQEYGVVEGRVLQKALLPKNDKVLSVRVELPKGLITSYNDTLKFDQQMQGAAEIITEERRFIERLFDKLISAFKNH
jgi:multidrug resistance efflux pump